jgi:GNAT superfamily N-acetyltransferase
VTPLISFQSDFGSRDTLRDLLAAAVEGRPPDADGLTDMAPAPLGARAAIVAFTGHHVVAADVDPRWVADWCPPWALEAPFGPEFVAALAERVDGRAGNLDLVLVADSVSTCDLDLRLATPDEIDEALEGAPNPRRDVRMWRTPDRAGQLLLGRGLEGRWEVAIEVAPAARGHGLGRALATAARSRVGSGECVFAQIAPGNVASLRAALAARYRPVAAEILFFD